MATEIKTKGQVLEVGEVTDIRVTDIGEDGSGGFLRRLSIFGSAGFENVPPALEIILKSDEAAKIRFTTPEIDF